MKKMKYIILIILSRNKTTGTEMSKERNNPQTGTEPCGKTSREASADASLGPGGECVPPRGIKSVLKMLWRAVNAIFDYFDEEIPEHPEEIVLPKSKIGRMWVGFNSYLDSFTVPSPEQDGASGSRPKKAWAKFNAFLDSLEEASPAPTEEGCVPESPAEHGSLLKKTGNVCWEIVFHGTIAVFLFVLAIFGTIRTLDFVNSRHVPFYPSDEIRQFLASEHESLEAVADELPAGKARRDNIPADRFGERCAALLKPVRIYSDDYGVYLMTSKNWYVGENGIFIARDKHNMPDDMSWGLIEGRVYTYAFSK